MKYNSSSFPQMRNQIIFHPDEKWGLQTYMKTNLSFANQLVFEFTVKHSRHSRKRASQRSIDYNTLLTVLLYGTPFYRQGMTFYTVFGKDIPDNLNQKLVEKIRNLVVVLGGRSTQIVTCYKATNAVKYLRRKGKELKKPLRQKNQYQSYACG